VVPPRVWVVSPCWEDGTDAATRGDRHIMTTLGFLTFSSSRHDDRTHWLAYAVLDDLDLI